MLTVSASCTVHAHNYRPKCKNAQPKLNINFNQTSESKLTRKCLVTDCFGESKLGTMYTAVTLVPQVSSFSSVAQ